MTSMTRPALERSIPQAVAQSAQGRYALVSPAADVWDAFVQQHPQGHLLQHAAWGTLKASAGWQVQRIAVLGPAPTTPPAAQLMAGAQVLLRVRYGVSVAYVPRGPLFSGDPEADALLLHALRQLARRHRAIYLRLEPNLLETDPAANALHTLLLLHSYTPTDPIQPRSSVHVDLRPPPTTLFASFSKGHRADIRRAERQGVQVRVGTADDLPAFYAIMQATSQRAAFGIHSAAYYRQAWELFQPRACLLLATRADDPAQVVAAHLVFADALRGYYLYSGATEAGLKSGANHLLEWHALQWAQQQGCSSYDLWGVPDALGQAAHLPDHPATAAARAALEAAAQDDPLIGVYRFKKGFGGQVVRYLPAYDLILLAPLYRAVGRLRRLS